MTTNPLLNPAAVDIVRFCAVECELQRSGERSVGCMVNAWLHAMTITDRLTVDDVVTLGRLVEPAVNALGLRRVGVRVGHDIKPDAMDVPRLLASLIDGQHRLTPAEWFREFEEVHPFRDGNGRTGQILYNLLRGTLHDPDWAPNFWHDDRRRPGDGAPEDRIAG